MTECRYVIGSPRLLRTHLGGCDDAGCAGCQPCGERHCLASGCPGRHLGSSESRVCASCVGYVRKNLAGILAMSGDLLEEAIYQGVNSEAAALDGPVAQADAWRQRRRFGYRDHPDDVTGESHPLWVLGTWDLLVAEHLGHGTRTGKVTIASAVSYIGKNLTYLAQDDDFPFDEFSREVRSCHGHLEDVLSEGVRTEKGAPCPACTAPALIRRYGATEAFDTWECPACLSVWSEADYRIMIDGVYIEVAEWLTAPQLELKCRVRPGTVRQWANRGEVRKQKTDDGKTLYEVAAVQRMISAEKVTA